MTEVEKEASRKILTKEALRLLGISLKFQDEGLSNEFLKIATVRLWPKSRKQRFKHLLKSSLVSGLLLDLIVNKPEIIVLIITDLYENHLNLLKEGKISANKRFNSFLAQNIKSLSLRGLADIFKYVIDTNVGYFIFRVCESLLWKNTNDLIETVEKHSPIIGKLSKDFDSFKAYMEFLNVYSCVLEVISEIRVRWSEYEEFMFAYVLRILEFYEMYYKKLYSELQWWQRLFLRNLITNNTEYTLTPKKEQGFAFTFTIYYLMIKTIECIAKISAKINAKISMYSHGGEKSREVKLRKLVIDYLLYTYVHFCENILLEPWNKGSKGEGICRYFVLPSTYAHRTEAATLLKQTYKLIHKNLEFDLLYKTVSGSDPSKYYTEYKQKIYRIAECKSIIKRWVNYLRGR
jgi:hypothetical protein